ncbi:MAG: PIG-L family deacetylase [Pseudomonadota bacterium]
MSEAEAAGTDWAETLLAHCSLLVVAPHPDDETLGCGGLIALMATENRAIAVLFTTDGGASHRSEAWPRERLADLRAREANAALAALGAGHAARRRLGLRDADMAPLGSPEGDAALAATRAFLKETSPDLVVLPWRRDPHRDHRDSHALVSRALADLRATPTRLEYAIWLDELGRPEDHPRDGEMRRRALPIASILAAKHDAVAAHISQITDLIDDPNGFRLTPETIARLTGPEEIYWEPVMA